MLESAGSLVSPIISQCLFELWLEGQLRKADCGSRIDCDSDRLPNSQSLSVHPQSALGVGIGDLYFKYLLTNGLDSNSPVVLTKSARHHGGSFLIGRQLASESYGVGANSSNSTLSIVSYVPAQELGDKG